MFKRSLVLATGLALAGVALAEDARTAKIVAALPAEVDGAKPAMQDVIDESGTPPALTVVRFYAGEAGMIQIQVRLWTAAKTAAEAATMMEPETLKLVQGEAVEIGGHKGSIISGVLNLYPGYPDKGLTVSAGPSADRAVLEKFATSVDIGALLAIE